MAIENKRHSKNTLEHVKFTPDSDSDNSIVQTFEQNKQSLAEDINYRVKVISTLECILDELKKMNVHLNLINESDL